MTLGAFVMVLGGLLALIVAAVGVIGIALVVAGIRCLRGRCPR